MRLSPVFTALLVDTASLSHCWNSLLTGCEDFAAIAQGAFFIRLSCESVILLGGSLEEIKRERATVTLLEKNNAPGVEDCGQCSGKCLAPYSLLFGTPDP